MLRRVLDTDDPLVGKLHELSIIPPFQRRRKAHVVRRNYLTKLNYGRVKLEVAETPIRVKKQVFNFPDQEFGKWDYPVCDGYAGRTARCHYGGGAAAQNAAPK